MSQKLGKSSTENDIVEDMKVLELFGNLSELFMLDYYTAKGYNFLPGSWLDSAKIHQQKFVVDFIAHLTLDSKTNNLVLPLSLLSFITLARSRISRRHLQKLPPGNTLITRKEHIRHLKPKKIVELESLLPFIETILSVTGTTHVVDIGSGMGHASRFIATHFSHCHVLRIEAQSKLIEKAENIDQRFSKGKAQLNIFSSVCQLRLDNQITSSFEDILTEIDSKNGTKFSHSKILLLGLHSCGNLGSYILKLFSECTGCSGVIMISCCYLYIDADEHHTGGFPLSQFVTKKNSYKLSLPLKEQACHNVEFYLARLQHLVEEPCNLSQHWRSIADIFIAARNVNYAEICFKFKKRKGGEDIIQFINKNLRHYEMELLSEDEITLALDHAQPNQWRVWAYYFVYIVKLLLGMIGESLILNDRLLYLLESGLTSKFEVVFSPKISPRNMAIISYKES